MKRFILLMAFLGISVNSHAELPGSPAWAKNMVMYEVNVRNYTEEGTFKAFEQHLPRLKALGVNTLWFMPIQPVGKKKSKGSLGSPYAIQNYAAINPRLGTMEDFKALVAKAHDMEMKVLIEWVANHTSWDNTLTTSNPEWYVKDNKGNFVPPKPDWDDVIELDYAQPGLTEYMQDQILSWINNTNIDGFRFDVAGLVPHKFWQELKPKMDAIKPVYVFTDGKDVHLMNDSLDLVYDYDFLPVMEDVAHGKASASAIQEYLVQESQLYGQHKSRLYFTSGHLANSFAGSVFERLDKAAEPFAALTTVLPGIPLIYSGQEASLNKRLAFFDKDIIEWKTDPMTTVYSQLFQLKQNPALWSGQYAGKSQWLSTSQEGTLALLRQAKDSDDSVLALFNFSDRSQQLSLSAEQAQGAYIDVMNYQQLEIKPSNALTMPPWSYRILAATK
mgnify:CR=1 FL=1